MPSDCLHILHSVFVNPFGFYIPLMMCFSFPNQYANVDGSKTYLLRSDFKKSDFGKKSVKFYIKYIGKFT